MSNADVIIVGSGINSLVCGALLAKRGLNVCMLERNELLGGCIRTEELTVPGFLHDTLSTLYPLFVTAPHYASLEADLRGLGVHFRNCETPTAVLCPNGRHAVLTTSREQNVATFESLAKGDGAAYVRAMEEVERDASLIFGLLGKELWTWDGIRLLARELRIRGARGLVKFFGRSAASCRVWLDLEFRSEVSRALIAPWVLHVGLSPESAMSSLMAKVILMTLERAGAPMVAGGGGNLVDAFAQLIRERGGEIHANTEVTRVLVEGQRAYGVSTADGRKFLANRAVVCNVTPTQLYRRLLPAEDLPGELLDAVRAHRPGRADMQIHLALDCLPEWPQPELSRVAMLHVTEGLDAVSASVNEAQRGLLPSRPTIVVAQPVALDPARAPAGKGILWIQLQELPGRICGDALGEIAAPADGRWTEEVRERYADRIIARLESLIPNLRRVVLGRRVLSPVDLEALNVNLEGGDPYSGACDLDQFLLWRPFPGSRNHTTPFKGLYHIGASTHPGPGLGGMSGFLVAAAIRR
jgi:phytoene dehydrogenase-like protein